METINKEEWQEIEADLETIASAGLPVQKPAIRGQTRIDEYCDSIIQGSKRLILLAETYQEAQYKSDCADSFEKVMNTAMAAERLALEARRIPCAGREEKAYWEEAAEEVVSAEIGFTEDLWFSIRLPMLLPKKEKATREYLNGLIYPVLRRYFRKMLLTPKFDECVIIYRHVYAYKRPQRFYRDHDNIEVNQITDALAMFVMRDDGPALCSHYHCMAKAPESRTEVYVIPKKDFVKWLSMEPDFPEEGVKLIDPPQYSSLIRLNSCP